MARNHNIAPQVPLAHVTVVRLGAGNAANQRLKDVDAGKIVKLVGTDRYDLAAVGNQIEGIITSVEVAPQNGFTIGGICALGKAFAKADGSQAAGTGQIAVGDYVVCGDVTPLNTAIPEPLAYPKVRKATSQTYGAFTWRVVSLWDGDGSVGTQLVIERI